MPDAPSPLHIVLADDSALIREKLRLLISTLADVHICGEAESAEETISFIESAPSDVLILDFDLKRGTGLDVIKALRQNHPELIIVVLTIHAFDVLGPQCLGAGANFYFEKGETFDPILNLLDELNLERKFKKSRPNPLRK